MEGLLNNADGTTGEVVNDVSTVDAQETQTGTTEAPAQSSEPTYGDILSSDGSLKEDWNKELGVPELAESTILNRYKSIQTLAKGLDHAERLVGKKVILPKDMDEETRTQFYKDLGVPEDAKGYEFKEIENVPDGVSMSEQGDVWFAQKAKDLGIPKETATQLRADYAQFLGQMSTVQLNEQAEAQGQTQAEAQAELLKMYNGSESLVQESIVGARKTAEALATDILGINKAEDIGFIDWNNPQAIKFFEKIGGTIGDDKLVSMSDSQSVASKAEMQLRLKEVMADPAYFDTNLPNSPKIKAEHRELINKLYS